MMKIEKLKEFFDKNSDQFSLKINIILTIRW